ncbi:unnamed protein product, partial [Closterium sp. NIES-54]
MASRREDDDDTSPSSSLLSPPSHGEVNGFNAPSDPGDFFEELERDLDFTEPASSARAGATSGADSASGLGGFAEYLGDKEGDDFWSSLSDGSPRGPHATDRDDLGTVHAGPAVQGMASGYQQRDEMEAKLGRLLRMDQGQELPPGASIRDIGSVGSRPVTSKHSHVPDASSHQPAVKHSQARTADDPVGLASGASNSVRGPFANGHRHGDDDGEQQSSMGFAIDGEVSSPWVQGSGEGLEGWSGGEVSRLRAELEAERRRLAGERDEALAGLAEERRRSEAWMGRARDAEAERAAADAKLDEWTRALQRSIAVQSGDEPESGSNEASAAAAGKLAGGGEDMVRVLEDVVAHKTRMVARERGKREEAVCRREEAEGKLAAADKELRALRRQMDSLRSGYQQVAKRKDELEARVGSLEEEVERVSAEEREAKEVVEGAMQMWRDASDGKQLAHAQAAELQEQVERLRGALAVEAEKAKWLVELKVEVEQRRVEVQQAQQQAAWERERAEAAERAMEEERQQWVRRERRLEEDVMNQQLQIEFLEGLQGGAGAAGSLADGSGGGASLEKRVWELEAEVRERSKEVTSLQESLVEVEREKAQVVERQHSLLAALAGGDSGAVLTQLHTDALQLSARVKEAQGELAQRAEDWRALEGELRGRLADKDRELRFRLNQLREGEEAQRRAEVQVEAERAEKEALRREVSRLLLLGSDAGSAVGADGHAGRVGGENAGAGVGKEGSDDGSEERVRQAKEEAGMWRSKVAELEREMEQRDAEISGLRGALDDSSKAVAVAERAAAGKEREVQRLTAEVREKGREVWDLIHESELKARQMDAVEREASRRAGELEDAQGDLAMMEREAELLRGMVKERGDAIDAVKAQLAERDGELARLGAEAQAMRADAEETVRRLKEELEEAREQVGRGEVQLLEEEGQRILEFEELQVEHTMVVRQLREVQREVEEKEAVLRGKEEEVRAREQAEQQKEQELLEALVEAEELKKRVAEE